MGREARMEEFAGVSGVWTTGRCEEESAGAVEVVIFFLFSFLFFSFFWMGFLGFVGWGMMTFRFLMRDGGRGGLVGAFF